MPLAVVTEEPVVEELKTCPPDGYVAIRRMTWGEKLERRKFTSTMDMELQRGSGKAKSTIDIFKEEVEIYDFMHCVVEHNLTKLVDAHGQPCKKSNPEAREVPLDFTKVSDLKMIAGQVAEEIGTLIDKYNNFEEDADLGNSKGESAPTS